MKKYQASTPEALVIGAALQAYENAILYEDFRPILEEYGLTEIDPETWYPQQLTLDIQRKIKSMPNGQQMLVSIGMKIIDSAVFPPMDSLEQAVEAFAASYPMNFKHQAEEDVIRAQFVEEGRIEVYNCSPHSDEMVYGYVYALARRFAPDDKVPVVKFEDVRKIDSDDDMRIIVTY